MRPREVREKTVEVKLVEARAEGNISEGKGSGCRCGEVKGVESNRREVMLEFTAYEGNKYA